ncbi:MAG TPA: hypothetical protein VHX62_06110 [Solirubrobacteraceae bacterium]|nr:hypothetical protein [Solirubrobacteraceae bacterium]
MNTSTATFIQSATDLGDGVAATGRTSVDLGRGQVALHNVRRLVTA